MLVPAFATLSFAAYLVYSSFVLASSNDHLTEMRDILFPTLNATEENTHDLDKIVFTLNTAAASREMESLNTANDLADGVRARYTKLEVFDTAHLQEIRQLKGEFNDYYSQAYNVAKYIAANSVLPQTHVIVKMRVARNAYLKHAAQFNDAAQKRFDGMIKEATDNASRARLLGPVIGIVMLIVLFAMTVVITRGILVLERQVRDRTRRLGAVNMELQQEISKLKAAEEAKQDAEAASQTKGEFLANMSHEIRTPMNAIIGLSHLCMQTDMTPRQFDYMQKIHGSAKSLLSIINDILDISKIEAGKMEMEQVAFRLEDVVGSFSTIVATKAQEKNLEFLLETALDVPVQLIGDPLRLNQVLVNLAGNAVKFTEKGEVLVLTKVEERDAEHVKLRFTVKDTGIGMSSEQIDDLFQAFSQADSSVTRKFGGTGLGLSISKRLVEMMNGEIWVESLPGQGASFIFTATFQLPAERQATGQYTTLPAADLAGMRVLAVDDNESARHFLKSYLESYSFKVSLANNGVEALDAVKKSVEEGDKYDLIILDWKMPQMDGIEAARKIRKMSGAAKKTKVLLISSFSQGELLRHAEEGLVDGILSKPFQQSQLLEVILGIFGYGKNVGRKVSQDALYDPALMEKIKGAHLLLVEDNEINRQVAQELLEKAGVSVVAAENGEEAVALLLEQHFDGVLMDMQMPVMDGITAATEIRKYERFSSLPIIAMTANVMVSDLEKYFAAGMNDHIGKPIDPDTMIAKLAKWIVPSQKDAVKSRPKREETPVPEAPPEISGVNVADSLRRMGGGIAIYYRILEQFRLEQKNVVAEIRTALSAGDRKRAERLAHTLKSVSGTIGAEELQDKSKDLENNIRDNTNGDTDYLLTQVEQALASLLAEIDKAVQARSKKK